MPVLDMDHEHLGKRERNRMSGEVVTGDIASYTYSSVSGAKLALYPARRYIVWIRKNIQRDIIW